VPFTHSVSTPPGTSTWGETTICRAHPMSVHLLPDGVLELHAYDPGLRVALEGLEDRVPHAGVVGSGVSGRKLDDDRADNPTQSTPDGIGDDARRTHAPGRQRWKRLAGFSGRTGCGPGGRFGCGRTPLHDGRGGRGVEGGGQVRPVGEEQELRVDLGERGGENQGIDQQQHSGSGQDLGRSKTLERRPETYEDREGGHGHKKDGSEEQ